MLDFLRYIPLPMNIGESKLFTGTEQLLQDLTTRLLILAPILGLVVYIFFMFRANTADEQDAKRWKSRATASVVITILIIVSSGLFKIILSYYS